ncbi:hypothetical protein CPB86DRAFT_792023 [Serendipita vermifera]|nr:hypothetical protein CPB86DRAFT_792023 [Serendipita vermifera]
MGSLENQRKESFYSQGSNIVEIRHDIVSQFTSIKKRPDIWYFQTGDSPTKRELRWYLIAKDDWRFPFEPSDKCHEPHLYFVDIQSYQGNSARIDLDRAEVEEPSSMPLQAASSPFLKPADDQIHYIVALLHYSEDGKDFDEPVSIPWGIPCKTQPCGTLRDHIGHLPATSGFQTFIALDMRELCPKIGFDDDGHRPRLTEKSDKLLSTDLGDETFKKQTNDLYLQCRQ